MAVYAPLAVTMRSWAMSASGLVIKRVLNPVPGPVYVPVVIPAANTRPGAVVVTEPLLAEVPVPDAEAPTSNGLLASNPLYSVARMSTYGVAVLNATVTVFAPAADALMFFA